jgi:hypothetical protein
MHVDHKIGRRIKLASQVAHMGARERVETSIRARFHATRASYNTDLKGYSLNLTIGICGFGNLLRVH